MGLKYATFFREAEKCRKISGTSIGQNEVPRRCYGIAALYLCIMEKYCDFVKKLLESQQEKSHKSVICKYYEIHLPVSSCDSRRRTAVKDEKKPYHNADMKKGKRQPYKQDKKMFIWG